MTERKHQHEVSSARLGYASLIAVGLAVGGCVSSTDIDALHDQIADVQRQAALLQQQGSSKQEVAQLEATIQRQTEALLKAEADMRLDINSLSAQIAQLQDKLEDTNYRLAQVSQQIAATNQDLKASRSVPAAPGTPARSDGGGRTTAADPETLYQTSYSDYLRGNYDLAMLGFKQYLEAFPETDLADNAIYWIGECFYRQQKYVDAISRVRPGAQAVSAQRQDRQRPAEEGLRAARAGTAQGRHRPVAERREGLPRPRTRPTSPSNASRASALIRGRRNSRIPFCPDRALL
jgi:TolA-binding protein